MWLMMMSDTPIDLADPVTRVKRILELTPDVQNFGEVAWGSGMNPPCITRADLTAMLDELEGYRRQVTACADGLCACWENYGADDDVE